MKTVSDLNGKYEAMLAEMARLSSALENFEFPQSDQQHSPGYREWERFILVDGGTTDGSGNLTIGSTNSALRPAPQGWEAYLTAIAVTAQGASSTASVTVYAGGVSDSNLLDFAAQMNGSSPSRIVGFYDPETAYFLPNQHLHVVITGAQATVGVIVRATGKRRQI